MEPMHVVLADLGALRCLDPPVHNFLDAFYLSRIGIRMLIGQYLELRKPPKKDYLGLASLVSRATVGGEGENPPVLVSCVTSRCRGARALIAPGRSLVQRVSPRDLALTAIEDAKYMCTRQHGDAPDVTLHGRLDLTFAYVEEHVHYILLELLKNSMR